jgi:hypothetical protein
MIDTTYGYAIRVLLANALSLGLAFLWVGQGGKETRSDGESRTQQRCHHHSPKGCSSLNLDRIVIYEKKRGFCLRVRAEGSEMQERGEEGRRTSAWLLITRRGHGHGLWSSQQSTTTWPRLFSRSASTARAHSPPQSLTRPQQLHPLACTSSLQPFS